MNAKAPLIRAARSSGSSCSPSAVDRTTSAKRTVANLRSPSTGRGAPSGDPQLLQKRAPSWFSALQVGQVDIVATIPGLGAGEQERTGPAAGRVASCVLKT